MDWRTPSLRLKTQRISRKSPDQRNICLMHGANNFYRPFPSLPVVMNFMTFSSLLYHCYIQCLYIHVYKPRSALMQNKTVWIQSRKYYLNLRILSLASIFKISGPATDSHFWKRTWGPVTALCECRSFHLFQHPEPVYDAPTFIHIFFFPFILLQRRVSFRLSLKFRRQRDRGSNAHAKRSYFINE